MARTKTTETPAPKPAEAKNCACGCGESVARTFKQGHDQILISRLASDIVYADQWGGTCAGIIKKTEVSADIQVRIDKVAAYMRGKLTDALAAKFVRAADRAWELEKTRDEREAAKAKRKSDREAAAAAKKAAKAATPSEEAGSAPKPARKPRNTKPVATNADVDAIEAEGEAAAEAATGPTLGATVKVKVGKAARLRTATVTGMNQAGKVTAVTIKTGDREVVKTDGFEVVAG
jgi:ATPase subunit of ABC transporter with duplicated ATPase domains